MAHAIPWLVGSVPAALLAVGLIPSGWANRRAPAMCRLVVAVTTIAFLVTVATAAGLAAYGPSDTRLFPDRDWLPIGFGVYFDSLTAVMAMLISFVGFIIARFSVRYLHGDPAQGRFMRWIAFTLGAVLLLVVSRDLLMFTLAWMLTSFGLHQLLTHYRERPGAVMAARKKFLISRLGDVFLVAALVLTFREFGTFEFSAIFAACTQMQMNPAVSPTWITWIGTLYVLGAMTKSAQFPFHSWLPDTMETPTPVSALMHAGIINAGGFLVIRLSPLVSQSSFALDFLAVIGGGTALFAAVVMLTQVTVKRALAYSTVAQMGFMMLQCGLGAFSAALLHIVAHSLYKSHAFLNSGDVIRQAARHAVDFSPRHQMKTGFGTFAVATVAAATIVLASGWIFGFTVREKPGVVLQGLVLFVALTQLLSSSLATGQSSVVVRGLLGSLLVCVGYCGAYLMMDHFLASSVVHRSNPLSAFDVFLMTAVGIGFIATFGFQYMLRYLGHRPLVRKLYVHLSNGCYIDIAVQKLVLQLWGRTPAENVH